MLRFKFQKATEFGNYFNKIFDFNGLGLLKISRRRRENSPVKSRGDSHKKKANRLAILYLNFTKQFSNNFAMAQFLI